VCGIVGIWNRDGRPVDRSALRRAVAALARRGPDDEGYVLIDTRSGRAVACRGADTRPGDLPDLDAVRGDFDLALGHRRLAIVDASDAGHQPMTNAEGDAWIVFNGMIYDFRALRAELAATGVRFRSATDTEVVLEAYRRWGTDCLTRFNGMWAFALWDARARRLVVSRDRIGIKPLVHRIDAHRAIVASELAALAPFGALADGIEPRALHHYLSLMQVPAPYTIFRGARKLQPARTLTIDAGGVREERYWRPRTGQVVAPDLDEARAELEALLADAVGLRLVADARVGAFVSGGVDSGVVAALAARAHAPERLSTFAITAPSEPDVDESPWSRAIASVLGSEHEEIALGAEALDAHRDMLDLYAEPFAVSSVLGVYLVARAARARVKVLLAGDGGDELFAGYAPRHWLVDAQWDGFPGGLRGRLDVTRALAAGQWVRWRARTPAIVRRLRLASLRVADAAGRDAHAMRRRCLFNDVEKHAIYSEAWAGAGRAGGEDTIPWLRSLQPATDGDRVLRRQLHDVDTLLPDEMATKLDRGTMAWGIEGRVPLLDHRVVEHTLSSPLAHRVADGEGKRLLHRVAARHLPPEVLAQPKRGFTMPLASWLRGPHRALVRDTLAPAAVARTGVFDATAVGEVLAWFEREPTYETGHMVFALLTFQLWHDRWARGGA